MPVNIYDRPADAQFINTYERMPFEKIMQAGMASQQRWDRGEALRDDLMESLDVDALKHRTPQKQAAVGKWRKEIEDLISSTGEEYHKALPKLETLHRKLQTELKEGELAGLQGEYNQRIAYEKELEEMVKNKKNPMPRKRAAELLVESDRRSQLTSALEKDDYGTWTKNQYRGMDPIEYQDLTEGFNTILKDMPLLTEETLGRWLTGKQAQRTLPPGMYEAINETIQTKGTKKALRQVLQTIAMTDPKYRNFIDQSVELKMGQLEALEQVQPGTKDGLLGQSEVDLELIRQLENEGIDIYSPEGQEAILRNTLERDFMEQILTGPVETAVQRQGGKGEEGTISSTYDQQKHTPPKHVGGGGGGDGYGGLNLPTYEASTFSAKIGTEVKGSSILEINENIVDQQKEIDKMKDGPGKNAAQEALQATINGREQMVAAYKADPNNETNTLILDNKPQPPSNAPAELVNLIENMTSDSYVPESIKTAGEVAQLPLPVNVTAEKAGEYIDFFNTTTENVRNVFEQEESELLNLTKLVAEQTKLDNPNATPAEIEEMTQYARDLYTWQDAGGFKAEKDLNNAIEDKDLVEDNDVHHFQLETVKELNASVKALSSVAFDGDNAKNYTLINAGDTGIEGENLYDILSLPNIKSSKTMITGPVGPSKSLPRGGIQISITDDNDKEHTVVVSPKTGMTIKEGKAYMGLYEALVKDLDHGPAWIEAAQGADITDNYDLSKKGMTRNSLKVVPNANNTYSVMRGKDEDNLEPFTLEDALSYRNAEGKYALPMLAAIRGAIDSELTEEEKQIIEDAGGLTSGGKINNKLKDLEVFEKIEGILDTPYQFNNKGEIRRHLNNLDSKNTKTSSGSNVLPSNNLKGYKTQAKKEAEALGAVEITSNDFDNITISDSAYAPYAQPVIKEFLEWVDTHARYDYEIDGLYRTDAYNKSLPHSVDNSLHKKGLGIDIDVKKGSKEYKEIMSMISSRKHSKFENYIIRDHYHGNPPHLHLEFEFWRP